MNKNKTLKKPIDMETLNDKMNQVADKIGVTRLGEALEHSGYFVAYYMYLNDYKVYYSEQLNELLNDLLTPLTF